MEIIVGIMWLAMSLLVIVQHAPFCKDLKGVDLFIVFIVLAVGGPIFIAASALEGILNCFLPEGWDNDE